MAKKLTSCLFCKGEYIEKGHITRCSYCGGDLHNREFISECACCGKRYSVPEEPVSAPKEEANIIWPISAQVDEV